MASFQKNVVQKFMINISVLKNMHMWPFIICIL